MLINLNSFLYQIHLYIYMFSTTYLGLVYGRKILGRYLQASLPPLNSSSSGRTQSLPQSLLLVGQVLNMSRRHSIQMSKPHQLGPSEAKESFTDD